MRIAWTEEEDNFITLHYASHISWLSLSKALYKHCKLFRSSDAVRNRWFRMCPKYQIHKKVTSSYKNIKNKTNSRKKWTSDEDIFLCALVSAFGPKWVEFSNELSRKENSIRNRYRRIMDSNQISTLT